MLKWARIKGCGTYYAVSFLQDAFDEEGHLVFKQFVVGCDAKQQAADEVGPRRKPDLHRGAGPDEDGELVSRCQPRQRRIDIGVVEEVVAH